MQQTLELQGRLWVREALSENDLRFFDKALNCDSIVGNRLEWSDSLLNAAGESSKLSYLVRDIMKDAKPVRFVSFNKTSKMNWSLPWHQDRIIAVKNKNEVKGFSNWSKKMGIWHCEPPIKILEDMLFARVYLDEADEDSGSLELAIGSHKHGKILSTDTERLVSKLQKETCIAKRGDVLLVKALTLHRSSVSHSKRARRVLRVDYANFDLPKPIEWKY